MPHPFLAIKEVGISALPILPNVPFDIQNSSNLRKNQMKLILLKKVCLYGMYCGFKLRWCNQTIKHLMY